QMILLERTTQNQLEAEAQLRVDSIADAALLAWRQEGIEAAVTILDFAQCSDARCPMPDAR
ncbi:MAG: hypothetical protein ACRC2R_23815, partial [Xenococcaceae cyanobacterium]